jgi:hypothetical protein
MGEQIGYWQSRQHARNRAPWLFRARPRLEALDLDTAKFTLINQQGTVMAIQFHCPSCNALLNVDDAHAGKRIKCEQCQQMCTAKAAPTAIQPTASAGPKPTANAATAVQASAPKPHKGGGDEPKRPPRRPGRDEESASSFTPVAIILIVGGVLMASMMALLCVVGVVGGLFFGIAEERAVKPMPIAVAEAPMPVAPKPIDIKPEIPVIKPEDKKIEEKKLEDKAFLDRKLDSREKVEKVEESPKKIKKKPTPPELTQVV